MIGKCYWYEEWLKADFDAIDPISYICKIRQERTSCLGEIYLCECDEQRKEVEYDREMFLV